MENLHIDNRAERVQADLIVDLLTGPVKMRALKQLAIKCHRSDSVRDN